MICRTSFLLGRKSAILSGLLLGLSLFQERLGDENVILGRNAPVEDAALASVELHR
jgi:hypothetical protein